MYIVSSCLAGINCRYDGKNHLNKDILDLVNKGEAIPLCPEILGGLETPRIPCEIIGKDEFKKVINKNGLDLTKEFLNGANKVLEVCKTLNVNKVILKSKSPSCGCGEIYDGTFSGNLIKGNGLTADLLIKNNIKVYNEKNFKNILD